MDLGTDSRNKPSLHWKYFYHNWSVLTKVKDGKNVLIPDEIPFPHSLPLCYNLESKVYAFGMQQIAPSVMGVDVFPNFSLWG